MADLLGVVKQMMEPDRHADAVPHPRAPHGVLPRARQRVPAHALRLLRGHRGGHRRGRQRPRRRPPDRGHPLLEVPVPGHPRRHGRVGDGGQPVPPAQDPLLDAHHRVQPRAVRAPGGRPQRAAASWAACSSPTPTSSSATSPASSTPTSSPSTSSPSSCCARCRCTSTRSGAEGELRAVSTQIDEICGRRDTLMHFLRKQVHAESSNRLVAFSRAVLEYWLTLDDAGLEPYVSANTLEAVTRRDEVGARAARRCCRAAPARRGRARPSSVLDELIALAPDELRPGSALDGDGRSPSDVARRRVALLVRTHQLLAHKYSLVGRRRRRRPSAILRPRRPARGTGSSSRWPLAGAAPPRARATACSTPRSTCSRNSRRSSSPPRRPRRVENIYQKRHIAAGIPSIYGNYTEPQVRRAGPVVPRREPRRPAAGGRGRRGHRALRDARLAAPHGDGDAALRAGARHRRRRLAALGDNLDHARDELRQPQLHLPPVPERLPVPRQQRLGPLLDVASSVTSRCCTPSSPTTRGSARRGACPSTPSPSWCCARCSSRRWACRRSTATSRPRCASISHAQRPPGQPRAHPHDELRPGAPRLAHPQAAARRGRPDHARLQGPGAQADGRRTGTMCPRASCSRPSSSAPCRRCRTRRSTTTPSTASARAVAALERRTGRRLGDPRAAAAALHPLGRGHLHAGPHDHVRQRRPQRPAGRGASPADPRSPGRPGTATAASCSRGPCPTASTATSSTPS